MLQQGLHTYQACLLSVAESVAFILADRLTPDSIRQLFTKLSRDIRPLLPPDSIKDLEAAEARAALRTLAHCREDAD
jgi:hypothetical protein